MAMKTVQKLSESSNGITLSLLATALLSLLVSFAVQAEQSKVFGNYTVHYSVFTTDNLTPSVAKQYNIPRSKKRALLNVSVLKKSADGSSKPSKAIIRGTTTNLNQQLRELELREISEKGAIYYIAETPVDHAEILKYKLDVTPQGEKTTYTLSFQEQFYID
ncbi:MAG: DUF4426 domain-containing protein [Gammaproteobacteria bacterium]|nr:MAG: DUF4426 domain-containing protein [Gammaproteobacteria bacterium]RKZ66831.1 MAG: DUF4426 domain-containing protein [Gammaproteobacteria bacterium]